MTEISLFPPRAVGVSEPPQIDDKAGKTAARDHALMEAVRQLETTFLSEMLKVAGLGKARDALGGGAGEDQFASFLRQAQAEEMVKSGGIGLAESLYQALKEKADGF